MTNYNSQLNLWGDTGESPPAGYSYAEGEQPVDAWDNFVTFNLIDDVTNHLVPLTNQRLDSSSGRGFEQRPDNPEDGHLYYDAQDAILEFWHNDTNQWLTVWHEGNDGEFSNLDADTVDGIQGGELFTSMAMWQSGSSAVLAGGDTDVETYNNFEYFFPHKVTIFTTSSSARGIFRLNGDTGNSASYSSSGSEWEYDEFTQMHRESIDEFQIIFDNSDSSGSEQFRVDVYGFYVE